MKYIITPSLRKWLKQHSIVAIGYFDECKRINLDSLLNCWVDMEYPPDFADHYPYADERMIVLVIYKEDEYSLTFREVVNRVIAAPHFKIWLNGEEIDNAEILKMSTC